MSVFECRRCGVLVSSNPKPDECPACDTSRTSTNGGFYRFDDVDELLS